MTREELLARYPNASASFIRANAGPDRVAPAPVGKPSVGDEPVAEGPGGCAYQGRCFISITSFRRRLCDERNLYDKHFVDALKQAGAFVDDSPKYVKVEVVQEKVQFAYEERTLISMTPCA